MPSPVGHVLAGVAVGWAVDGRRILDDAATLRSAVAFAMVAVLPDLDLLLSMQHRGPSHGIGAAFLIGVLAWGLTRRLRSGIAFGLAFASHILLDWLGSDTTPPIGLMALWPFSREFYQSPYPVFMSVSRRYWMPGFWGYNLRVVTRELLIMVPIAMAVGALLYRRTATRERDARTAAATLDRDRA